MTTFPKIHSNQLDAIDPSAGSYTSINAGQVVILDASGAIPAALGGGGGGGSVTIVGVTVGAGISASVANPTTTPNISISNTGVLSFNTRTGAVTLTSSDVTTALGFTPGSGSGSVTSVNASGGSTGLTFIGGPITSGGTLTLGGTLAIANGGTGQTTASAAINALLPSQTSNAGKVLSTDGTSASWATAAAGTVTSVGVTGSTGLSVGGSPIISSGTITLTLGTELQGLSSLSANGFVQRTGAGTYTSATLTASQIQTALGFTPGPGTVTSVGITAGSGIGVSGSPVTGSGSITISNSGVTSVAAGAGINVSGATGGVVISGTLFTSSASGLVPASGGGTTNFLRADGTWAAPAGGGGGSVTSVAMDTSATGLTVSSGSSQTITTSGTFTIGGTLNVASGGTGTTSISSLVSTLVTNGVLIQYSAGFTNVRVVANPAGSGFTQDGLYVGYSNGGGSGSLTRIYGGGSTSSNVTVDASGNLVATGNVTAFSDIRLKTEIEVITDALEKVSRLRGITYLRTDTNQRQIGLIAQQVQQVVPEAVQTSETGYLGVAYGNLVGLLVESIKELKQRIEKLEKK